MPVLTGPSSRGRSRANSPAVILHPPLGPLAPPRRAAPRPDPVRDLRWTLWPAIGLLPPRVREAYELPWGVRERAVSAWLVAGWRAWRPFIPRTWRQMPKALAADSRVAETATPAPFPGAPVGDDDATYESSRGNLGLNIVARRSIGVAASRASSNVTVPPNS